MEFFAQLNQSKMMRVSRAFLTLYEAARFKPLGKPNARVVWGYVLKAAELAVAMPLVKPGGLKAHSIEAYADAAALLGHVFAAFQQQRADAGAAIALGDP